MPPRARYTPRLILDAALAQTRDEGVDSVTARSVAAALGCSTAPIFTQFESMEALHDQLHAQIVGLFAQRVEREGASAHDDPLIAAGIGWARFAQHEPMLYEAIFLRRIPTAWHTRWGPVRRALAARMAAHPRYAALDDRARFALVGRASIIMHGLALEIWSGRLAAAPAAPLLEQLILPTVEAAIAHDWTQQDLHSTPNAAPLAPPEHTP